MRVLNIREAVHDDVSVITEMESDIFTEPWTKEDISNAVDDSKYTVLVCSDEADGQIAGYIIFLTVCDSSDLCVIAVDKRYRHDHIGERLLEKGLHAVKQAGAGRVLLEVRAGNMPAVGLYKKKGFHSINMRKNYYSRPVEDALVMILEME